MTTRGFMRIGSYQEVSAFIPRSGEAQERVGKVFIAHSVRVEDTFFGQPSFRAAMDLKTEDELRAQHRGVTVLAHRITSDAVSIGAISLFRFTIKARNSRQTSPRFGKEARIVQPYA